MKLAQDGVLFRQAYCAAPTCSPSRAALLTGQAPHSCGMTGLVNRGFRLNDDDLHLVRYLNANGYETVLCGIQHEASDGGQIGYQYIVEDDPYPDRDHVAMDLMRARKTAAYIRNRSAEDRPFFLSFGMFNTHRPFPPAAADINPDYVSSPHPIFDTTANREDMAGYLTSLRAVDECVGMVMDALRAARRDEDTLVIFTTDHGLAFPEMKCSLYDTGIGVSLILRTPEKLRQGEAVDALVSQLDLFPTLCDYLQLDRPHWLQGQSLMPLLRKETDEVRDEIFAEVNFHAAYEPMRCIRTDRYKWIRRYDHHRSSVPANIDDCPGKDFLIVHGYLETQRDAYMLFDLYLDPLERVNVADDPRYRDIREDLDARMRRWMERTNDPLLRGKVEKPKGAQINKLTCISAQTQDFE
jgi:arylsulfatase A-like enzyme